MRKTNRLLVLMSMMLLQVATPSFLSAEEIGSQSLVTQDKRTVTGIVLDSKSNPLEGVAIIEDGTTNGVMTDADIIGLRAAARQFGGPLY